MTWWSRWKADCASVSGRRPLQPELARAVNVSDRTLRRRLQAQETNFRALRDTTRYERARDLLCHTALTMTDVAAAVGYADARAFRRAFKRWSGHLPADFRRQALAASSEGIAEVTASRPLTRDARASTVDDIKHRANTDRPPAVHALQANLQ